MSLAGRGKGERGKGKGKRGRGKGECRWIRVESSRFVTMWGESAPVLF
jgi:hypothetical protein